MSEKEPLLNTTRIRIGDETPSITPSVSPINYFEEENVRVQQQKEAAEKHWEKVERIWGDPPEKEHSKEDDVGPFGAFFYTWIQDKIGAAARGEIEQGVKPIPLAEKETCWKMGRQVSQNFQKELDVRRAWDPFIGCPVRLKRCEKSRGTLKWLGYIQQSKKARQLMAGVEWSKPPRFYKRNKLHDGVVHGETLFEADARSASVERPDDLRFVYCYSHTDASGNRHNLVSATPRAPSVIRALLATFWRLVVVQCIPKGLGDTCTLLQPIALEYFVRFLSDPHPKWSTGLSIVAAMFAIGFVQTIMLHKYYHLAVRCGFRFRSSLQGLIFEKCFTLSNKATAIPEMGVGRIVNMMSSDVERANDFCWFMLYLASSPIQGIVAMALLYRLVGWSALVGVASVCMLSPLQGMIVRRQHQTRTEWTTAIDKRVKATNELFSGIRIVKFMAWEPKFVESIMEKRATEIKFLETLQLYRVASSFISVAIPLVMIATTFISYHLAGNTLTPEIVFPAISLLGILRIPFMMVPSILASLVGFVVSMDRITKFLESEPTTAVVKPLLDQIEAEQNSVEDAAQDAELAEWGGVLDHVTVNAYVPVKLPPVDLHTAGAFRRMKERATKRLSCCRSKKKEDAEEKKKSPPEFYCLAKKQLMKDITVRVPRGKLTIVVGPTGSGKSTLLETFLGQLEIESGEAWCLTSVGYAPQQPWIMNGTVKDNIVFWNEFDEVAFNRAINACQLQEDLKALSNGIETEIGEKGVNLSGGQKARISLARSMYAKRSLYILDDPLSAVDAHVQERLVSDCILDELRDTTRLLATHQLHFLPKADNVIVLGEGGTIVYCGPPEDAPPLSGPGLAASPSNGMSSPTTGMGSPSNTTMGSPTMTYSPPTSNGTMQNGAASAEFPAEQPENSDDDNNDFVDDIEPELHANTMDDTKDEKSPPADPGKLTTVEEKAVGSVPWQTYWLYAKACGGGIAVTILMIIFTATELLNVSQNVWLSLWSTKAYNLSSDDYLYVYIAFVSCGCLSAPLRTFYAYRIMRRGSLVLHEMLLKSVAAAPMSFFDTTPLGRILNRFAKDIDDADNMLQMGFIFLLQVLFQMMSTLAIMFSSQWMVVFPLVPCLIVYYKILVFYNSANREIQRISSIAKSPVFALLSETLTGTRTILAYNKVSEMMQEACRRIDVVFASGYFRTVTDRWLGVRLEMLGTVIVTCMALATIIGKMTAYGSQNVGLLSLGMTLCLNITNTLNWIVRQLAAVEGYMNSVERITHYGQKIDQEDFTDYDNGKPRPLEPTNRALNGSIEFKDVTLQYRPGLPMVLNGVTFRIEPGEKIGVVGRTGSGKSTLMLAFLRVVDISSGQVLINGVPHSDYSLRDLRSRFSMIPQDPLLFEGTVRTNLDPFHQQDSDVHIWEALDQVGMKERVGEENKGLDATVLDGGSNFSVGQRQLLCLARALLKRDSRFILMDEATANIDNTMDATIQKTVKTAFADRTVVTIAHRLHTVLDCDKVLVMDKGRVGEMGSPVALGMNSNSLLHKMIASHGETQKNRLLKQLKKRKERSKQ